MIKTISLLLVLTSALLPAATDPIAEIRSKYGKIVNATKAQKEKWQFHSEAAMGDIQIERVASGSLSAIVVQIPMGDHSWLEERYYLENGEPFFALVSSGHWTFIAGKNKDGQPSTEDSVTENRYYFHAGKCIRELTKRASARNEEKIKTKLKKASNQTVTAGETATSVLAAGREIFTLKTESAAMKYFANRFGEKESTDFVIPEETISPDGRFGVRIPKGFDYREQNGNSIVEIETGKTIRTIHAATGAERQNHGGNHAVWTPDSKYLLWTVAGKWFPRSLVLLNLSDHRNVKEMDIRAVCQREFLMRTRAMHPGEYRATVSNEDMGSGYPDGFTIDFDYSLTRLEFPLKIQLNLTNDPKYMAEASPEYANRLLEGSMTAEIDADFNVKYSNFEVLAKKNAIAARNQ